jgi:NAD(P)-dependent dehydrogenase (short-subunit alcohol dehydrogenase family)
MSSNFKMLVKSEIIWYHKNEWSFIFIGGNSMKDKVIIVTGGSNGMGKGMAKRFATDGAKVVIIGRTLEKLEEAKKEIETYPGQVETIQLDIRHAEKVSEMIMYVDEKFGRIDALVNNAAGNFICPAENLSINGWKSVIDIVLNGTFYCSSAIGKYWIDRQSKGVILNMVATYAWNAGAGVIHSAAAKAGVLSMTRTLAVEWGKKYGIRVNAIAPGPIERTGGADKLWESEEAAKRTLNSVPLGRLGTPEEIAALATFLLSDESAFINGECITIDGGQWLNQFPF